TVWMRVLIEGIISHPVRANQAITIAIYRHWRETPLKSAWLSRARFFQGRTTEAIQLFASGNDAGLLGDAYGRSGRVAEAEKLASDLTADPTKQALTFVGLGDRNRLGCLGTCG